jgi:hypothetical protein
MCENEEYLRFRQGDSRMAALLLSLIKLPPTISLIKLPPTKSIFFLLETGIRACCLICSMQHVGFLCGLLACLSRLESVYALVRLLGSMSFHSCA